MSPSCTRRSSESTTVSCPYRFVSPSVVITGIARGPEDNDLAAAACAAELSGSLGGPFGWVGHELLSDLLQDVEGHGAHQRVTPLAGGEDQRSKHRRLDQRALAEGPPERRTSG